MADRAADLALLRDAAAAAGALALTFFRRDQQVWAKGDSSVVGEADIAVDRRLGEILTAARPAYGWLSEETADTADRLARDRVFVVDPIDGTRAFIAGREEWAVSLAVVEAGRPTVAVLRLPALGLEFRAIVGEGAFLGDRPIAASTVASLAEARFAASRRYARAAARAAGREDVAVRYVPSLAYRLALVAAGSIDVAVARGNARDWDLAAADLLVHEAGACLTDLSGRRLEYNRAEAIHPALVAANPVLIGPATGLVREVDRRDG